MQPAHSTPIRQASITNAGLQVGEGVAKSEISTSARDVEIITISWFKLLWQFEPAGFALLWQFERLFDSRLTWYDADALQVCSYRNVSDVLCKYNIRLFCLILYSVGEGSDGFLSVPRMSERPSATRPVGAVR